MRFDAVAGDYARHRPGYPVHFLEALLEAAGEAGRPGADAVDLGCGTGISSRALSARGLRVTGIDPSAAMLAEARAAGGGPDYREGTAEATGLPDGSTDLVVAAQCFHWFDFDAALAEIRRILRPEGWCAAFWNHRAAGDPLLDAYEALLRLHSREFGTPAGGRVGAMERLRVLHPAPRGVHLVADHRDLLAREAFLGRVRSASYVAHGVADRGTFEAELLRLFDTHATEGRVAWPMRTEGVLFRA